MLGFFVLVSSTAIMYFFDKSNGRTWQELQEDGFSIDMPYPRFRTDIGIFLPLVWSLFSLPPSINPLDHLLSAVGFSLSFLLFSLLLIMSMLMWLPQIPYVWMNQVYCTKVWRSDSKREKILSYFYLRMQMYDRRPRHAVIWNHSRPRGSECEECKSKTHLEYGWRDFFGLSRSWAPIGMNSWNHLDIILRCEKCELKRVEKWISRIYFNNRNVKISELSALISKYDAENKIGMFDVYYDEIRRLLKMANMDV